MSDELVLNGMRLLRLCSLLVEVIGLAWMIKATRVAELVRINALMGIAGPLIMVLVSLIGMGALAGDLKPGRLIMLGAGVLLILFATR